MAVGCEGEETPTTAKPSATTPEATPASPQQSAEKALKALWIARKADLAPRTHNLIMLARELGGEGSLVEAAAELTPEYVLTRYVTPEVALPDELYFEQSAKVDLAAAQAIRD
jgi:HEPN domain-containing protein